MSGIFAELIGSLEEKYIPDTTGDLIETHIHSVSFPSYSCTNTSSAGSTQRISSGQILVGGGICANQFVTCETQKEKEACPVASVVARSTMYGPNLQFMCTLLGVVQWDPPPQGWSIGS